MATAKDIFEKQTSIETMITSRIEEFEKKLNASATSSEKKTELGDLARDFASFKEMVVGVLRLLQDQVSSLAGRVEEMDCYSRRNALLFSGIEEHDGEDPAAVITNIVAGKMGLDNFDKSQIQHCIRIGAKNAKRSRPILVKFTTISGKASIWGRKTQLKSSGTVVGEFLTKSRQEFYARARRHFGVNACWTMNGAVFVRLAEDRVKIESAAQLDELCRKHPAVAPTTTAAAKTPSEKPVSKSSKPVTRSKATVSSKDKR